MDQWEWKGFTITSGGGALEAVVACEHAGYEVWQVVTRLDFGAEGKLDPVVIGRRPYRQPAGEQIQRRRDRIAESKKLTSHQARPPRKRTAASSRKNQAPKAIASAPSPDDVSSAGS